MVMFDLVHEIVHMLSTSSYGEADTWGYDWSGMLGMMQFLKMKVTGAKVQDRLLKQGLTGHLRWALCRLVVWRWTSHLSCG